MPGGDRTGPMGAGPMTGRGAGFCAGYDMPGYANPAFGRGAGWGGGWGRGFGRGYGRGGGRGWRRGYWATGAPGWARGGWAYPPAAYAPYPEQAAAAEPSATQELRSLRDQAKYLQHTLDEINQRIDELKRQRSENNEG